MKQLEMIYLMNVLQYIQTSSDLLNFLFINSKCFEAIQATRKNVLQESYCKDKSLIIPQKKQYLTIELFKKQFLLFHQMETIECKAKYIHSFSDEICYHFEINKPFYFNLLKCSLDQLNSLHSFHSNNLLKYIRELHLILNSNEILDKQFQFMLNKLKITFIDCEIESINQTIDSLVYYQKTFRYIPNIILISNTTLPLQLYKLFPFSDVTSIIKENRFTDEFVIHESSIPLITKYNNCHYSWKLPRKMRIYNKKSFHSSIQFCQSLECNSNTLLNEFQSDYLKEITIENISDDFKTIHSLDILDIQNCQPTNRSFQFPSFIDTFIINQHEFDFHSISNHSTITINKLYLDNHNYQLTYLPNCLQELHIVSSIIPIIETQLYQLTYLSLVNATSLTSLQLSSSLKKLEMEHIDNKYDIIDSSTHLTNVLFYSYDDLYSFQHPEIIRSLEIGNVSSFCLNSYHSVQDLILVSLTIPSHFTIPENVTRLECEQCSFISSINLKESKLIDIYIGYCSIPFHTIELNTILETIETNFDDSNDKKENHYSFQYYQQLSY